MKNSNGSSIVFIIAILAILSITGVTFVVNAVSEHKASANYEAALRARLALHAGMEFAEKNLRSWCEGHAYSWDSGVPPWFYYQLVNGQKISAAGQDLASYSTPSYTGNADKNGLETYKIKILDCASQININVPYTSESGLTRASGYPSDNLPLRIMLENLLVAIGYDRSNARPLANLLVDERNKKDGVAGWQNNKSEIFISKEDIKNINYSSVTGNLAAQGRTVDQFYNDIQDYICTSSWQDASQYWRSANISTLLSQTSNRTNPVRNTIANSFSVQREKRSPININTASRPVLIAVIAPLSGIYMDETIGSRIWANWSKYGSEKTVSITYSQACTTADTIIANRPFPNINKFEELVDQMSFLGDMQKDLVKVNFNPNIWLLEQNPTAVFYNTNGKTYCKYRLDKFHLRYLSASTDEWSGHTTEFCFDSMGYFEIEVFSTVTDVKGNVLARAWGKEVVKLYDLLRHTSQSNFVDDPTWNQYQVPGGVLKTFIPDQMFLGNGATTIQGGSGLSISGSIYVDNTVTLSGSVGINGSLSATGGITGNTAQVSGGVNPNAVNQSIPSISPQDYKSRANYIFTSQGVFDSSGMKLHDWSTQGNTYLNIKYSGETFSISGNQTKTPGVYYFDGDFSITGGGASGTWNATIFATGDISIGGNSSITSYAGDVALVAGGDISLNGTPGATYSGIIYANENVSVQGNSTVVGAIVAENSDGSQNTIGGSVTLNYRRPTNSFLSYPDTSGSYINGQTMISYPNHMSELGQYSSDFNGYISLGTVIGTDLRTYPPLFRAGFDSPDSVTMYGYFASSNALGSKALVLDPNGVNPGPYLTAQGDKAGDISYPANLPMPLLHPVRLPHLFPDGCYSDFNAVPAYSAVSNIMSTQGTISLWFKPNWQANSERSHHILSLTKSNPKRVFEVIYIGTTAPPDPNYPADSLHFRFDTSDTRGNKIRHHVYVKTPAIRRGGWNNLFISWDLQGVDTAHSILMYLNEKSAGTTVTVAGGDDSGSIAAGTTEDITVGNPGMRLGEWASSASVLDPDNNGLFLSAPPEVTYDEFVVFPNFGASKPTPTTLFNNGRYYNNYNPAHTTDITKRASFTLLGQQRFKIAGKKMGTMTWTVYFPKTQSCVGGSVSNPLLSGQEWNVQFNLKSFNTTTAPNNAGQLVTSLMASTNGSKDKSSSHNVIGTVSGNFLGYDVVVDHSFGVSPLLESPIVDDVTIVAMSSFTTLKNWSELIYK